MFLAEVGAFDCPRCTQKIDLRDTGQDFSSRMEAPKPFACPHCRQMVIFDPWTATFRFWLLGFLFLPFLFLYLGIDTSLILVSQTAMAILLGFSLLANKLIPWIDPTALKEEK